MCICVRMRVCVVCVETDVVCLYSALRPSSSTSCNCWSMWWEGLLQLSSLASGREGAMSEILSYVLL